MCIWMTCNWLKWLVWMGPAGTAKMASIRLGVCCDGGAQSLVLSPKINHSPIHLRSDSDWPWFRKVGTPSGNMPPAELPVWEGARYAKPLDMSSDLAKNFRSIFSVVGLDSFPGLCWWREGHVLNRDWFWTLLKSTWGGNWIDGSRKGCVDSDGPVW
jgi:hypothetical protein